MAAEGLALAAAALVMATGPRGMRQLQLPLGIGPYQL